MKHYSVNDSDLAQLSTYSGLAAWSFALGTFLVGMSVDLLKQFIANGYKVPEMPANPGDAFWSGFQWPLFACGLLFLLVALLLTVSRSTKSAQIKRETKFD